MSGLSTKEALFKLIRIVVGNEDDLSLPVDVNLSEVMDLSMRAGIIGMSISGLQKLIDNGLDLTAFKADKLCLMSWIGRSIVMEQKANSQWHETLKLVDVYAQNGITTVGLKGITVAQWYPNPMLRDSCDFDCFLLKVEAKGKFDFAYEDGNQVVEKEGVHVDKNIYVHSVFMYHNLAVENHHYLAAVKLSKRHRKMDELLRSLLLDEPLRPVMDSQLMMGSPMFNALFLTHHAHRHMLNEYMPLKLLLDWALFIKNNPTLEWQRFWRYVDEFGMLRFSQSMTRLACKLLGVSVTFDLPVDDEADRVLEEGLWDFPREVPEGKSLYERRLGIISNLIHARKRYKVFYDCSSFQMIVAYVKGYLFGGEE